MMMNQSDGHNARSDVMTPAQRSRCMSKIRGKNTKPELILRRALWRKGYRYRIHYPIEGKPDIVFPGKKVAVFIDGCFWHGCPLHGKKPTNNSDFWRKKIERNIRRDLDVNIALREQHWTVVRVWEHEVADNLDAAVSEIVTVLEA